MGFFVCLFICFHLKNKRKRNKDLVFPHSLYHLSGHYPPLKAKKLPVESYLHSLSLNPLLPFRLIHALIQLIHLVLNRSCSGQGNNDINISKSNGYLTALSLIDPFIILDRVDHFLHLEIHSPQVYYLGFSRETSLLGYVYRKRFILRKWLMQLWSL